MYRKPDHDQMTVYDFVLPFGGHLNENNRWIKLHDQIDWAVVEEAYEKNFVNKKTGNVSLSAQVAFGSLYIQRTIGCTDRELVQHISENPYMQYFIGCKEFTTKEPFDPSLLVHFRKRFPEDVISEINEKLFIKNNNDDDDDKSSGDGSGSPGSEGAKDDAKPTEKSKSVKNKGTVIIDATCTPADIAFPTDLELCDKARRWTERIFDHLWRAYGPLDASKKIDGIKTIAGKKIKPRTYRVTARHRFLKLNKRRKKSAKKIRKELRYQLNCIKRNLEYIESFILEYGFNGLYKIEIDRLLTIFTFHEQQRYMLDNKVHTVKDRIVSLSQPWVRPIVRGKSKAPTEFGAKISISLVDGYTYLDKMSFDAYNEGEHNEFVSVIERHKERFGCYPERVLADKIYRTKENRKFCKDNGIRMSGPKLGRRGKNYAEDLRRELKEVGERNAVEGKFGNAKRKFGLDLIMAKLRVTTGSMIGMDIFILNIERRMRECAALCCTFLKQLIFYESFDDGYEYMFWVFAD